MATKKQAESLIKQIEKSMADVSAQLDKLDDMISALGYLRDNYSNTYDSLQTRILRILYKTL